MPKAVPVLAVVTLLLVLLTSVSGALTLKRCLELARENNLSLKQQDERIALAAADVAVQRAAQWPTLQFGSSASYTSELPRLEIPALMHAMNQGMDIGVRDKYDIAVELSVPVFTGLRTRYLVRSAQERYERSQKDQTELLNTIYLEVCRLYYALEANVLSQEVLSTSTRRIENQLRQTRMYLQQAQATAYDTLEISNRLLKTETELLELRHRYRVAASDLANVLGIAAVDSIEASFDIDMPMDVPQPAQYEAQARQYRPELAVHAHLIREQEYQRKATRSSYFPHVYASSSFHYALPGVNFFGDQWMDYYTVTVQLQWELWSLGRRGGEIRRIDHAITAARLEREKAWHKIRQQVVTAYEELTGVQEQMVLQRRLVQQEQERYRIVMDRYAQGIATSFDLRDAEQSLTAAELALRRHYVGFLMNRAAMAYATGRIGAAWEY